MVQLSARPQWILFDAADTLIHAQPSVSSIYARLAKRFGHTPPSDVEIRDRFSRAMVSHFSTAESSEELDYARWRDVVTEVMGIADDDLFQALWDHFAKCDLHGYNHFVILSYSTIFHRTIPFGELQRSASGVSTTFALTNVPAAQK